MTRAQPARVLLIVGGGIAAYKSLELIRLLRARSVDVPCVMTDAAEQFVTPLSIQALSGEPVHRALFSLSEDSEIDHIALSRSADLLVVCPASANLLARMAAGIADDLATTVLLATDKPVLVAPAMNVRMWLHPATQANVALLKARSVRFVGPEEGGMACGEYGPGRLSEPAAILEAIVGLPKQPLKGRHVLVTAGPTREPIDPVRAITNHSSGRQGYAIAEVLAEAGARVTLVSGPTALPAPPGCTRIDVETAREMLAACESALPADAAICVAAVADWRVREASATKLKKRPDASPPTLTLEANPDILATLAAHIERPSLVIGFAAETGDVVREATAKRARKGCDWIVANDVSPGTTTFGGARNQVDVIDENGCEVWPELDKHAVARRLVARMVEWFANRKG
jgi:phosphopantothenoylcysteine decarboxylase / phosphopantothenate---cysteine ligase